MPIKALAGLCLYLLTACATEIEPSTPEDGSYFASSDCADATTKEGNITLTKTDETFTATGITAYGLPTDTLIVEDTEIISELDTIRCAASSFEELGDFLMFFCKVDGDGKCTVTLEKD